MPRSSQSERVPNKMKKQYDAIVALTDAVCAEHLDDRFAELARFAAAALARKRPSPLEHGWANTWGCGIVYALCYVNFVFDEGHKPHLRPEDMYTAFGVAASTGLDRFKRVREALKMDRFDPDWYLPEQEAKDPLAWYITFDGAVVDARTMSREVQQAAYEKGLIPYLPE
jgi:hypothetical protein